jgi:two-component system, OmpR family, response regulator
MRILLVEDDPELGQRLTERLTRSGFAVDLAVCAAEARDWPDIGTMAAIILDLNLPDGDGKDLLSHWRNAGEKVPILILTARGTWRDKVDGLNLGADDFIVKPVRFEELVARLHAVQRRSDGRASALLTVGDITLDPVTRNVTLGGDVLTLSRKEFGLLHLLLRRPGHVHSQGELLEHLYALEAERDLNAVEAQVSRLRKKIGRARITTIRGFGYRFDA